MPTYPEREHAMIAATFTGPNYSLLSDDLDTIEIFPTLEDVIEALFDRHSSNGQRLINSRFLDNSGQSVYWPNVEAGARFTCYLHELPLPSVRLPEDVIMDIRTAILGGWWDYTVTLAESDQGSLVATVERAGI